MSIDQLQTEYDQAGAAIAELTAALAEAENDAAEAKAAAAEVTDGQSVLMAMAEERAAMNRATITRRSLAVTTRQRADLARQLNRAQQGATTQLVRDAMTEACAALVDVYKEIVTVRDTVYQAQRAIGAYPVESPFDRVCSALEKAIGAAGGNVTPDSSGSVMVRFGDFQYIRRRIGYVAPTPPPARPRRTLVNAMQQTIAELNRYNRQHITEFNQED